MDAEEEIDLQREEGEEEEDGQPAEALHGERAKEAKQLDALTSVEREEDETGARPIDSQEAQQFLTKLEKFETDEELKKKAK